MRASRGEGLSKLAMTQNASKYTSTLKNMNLTANGFGGNGGDLEESKMREVMDEINGNNL